MKQSLNEYLPNLPYHPVKFKEALTPEQKWLVDWEEDFCTSCGTTTPTVSTSHHKDCLSYSEEPYKEYESAYTQPCPNCGGFEFIIDSSRELELSQISCMDCAWMVQESICEEDLLDKFNSGVYNKEIEKDVFASAPTESITIN